MTDLATNLVKLEELKHVPRIPMHEGHDPADPSALLVETLAMVLCSYCSGGSLRWRDRTDDIFCHQEDFSDEGVECEASRMLKAALQIGVPIYAGSELEFPEPDEAVDGAVT